jgi:hypothetical protein
MHNTLSPLAARVKSRAAETFSTTDGTGLHMDLLKVGARSSRSCPTFAKQTKSRLSESSIPPAVVEYCDFPERPVKSIAAKHGLAPAKLIRLARMAKVVGRKRGRRHRLKPSPMHHRIIEMYKRRSGHLIARKLGISPQRVYQILNRWKHILPPRPRTIKVDKKSSPVIVQRELRNRIVCFRLTAAQAGRVKELLGSFGLSKHVSDSRACRVVFLAMLGGYTPEVRLTGALSVPSAAKPV